MKSYKNLLAKSSIKPYLTYKYCWKILLALFILLFLPLWTVFCLMIVME